MAINMGLSNQLTGKEKLTFMGSVITVFEAGLGIR
jgi:hypothetical protein